MLVKKVCWMEFVFFNILSCRTRRKDSRGSGDLEPREGIRAVAMIRAVAVWK
jgi:hypothetical protein